MIGRDWPEVDARRSDEVPTRSTAQPGTHVARHGRPAWFAFRIAAWRLAVAATVVLASAATALAAQGDATRSDAARIAELEAQVSELRAQLQRALSLPAAPRGTPSTLPPASEGGFRAPPSALPRVPAVLMLEAGCPAGSVCLQLRCSERGWP